MLSITVLAVGRLKDRFFEDAAKEYLKRLSAYAKVEVVEVKAAELPENPSAALIAAALEREGEALLKKIPAGAGVITLCVEGRQLSSEAFADAIEKKALSGASQLVFVIGGSYGLAERVKRRSFLRLSMSEMTFPHRLARIMLLEQLYRAFKISRGETYHK